MSSESDGGESPRGWTLVDGRERTEDSDDSIDSSSSSDFVDLGEDRVQYHHVNRSSSAINIAPNIPKRPAASSSLPANFRPPVGGASMSQEEHSKAPASLDTQGAASSGRLQTNPTIHSSETLEISHSSGAENWNPLSVAGYQSSDLDHSVSSGSPLVGPESPLLSISSGGLGRSGNLLEGAGATMECSANFSQPSEGSDAVGHDADAEIPDEDQPSYNASDTTSNDSIEVISMPSDAGKFQGGDQELRRRYGGMEEVQNDNKFKAYSDLVSLEYKTEGIPHHDESCRSSPSDDTDTSEFERIEPEMMHSLSVMENQPSDADDEENKMDVAGARPMAQSVNETDQMVSSYKPVDQPQNLAEAQSHDQYDRYSSLFPSPQEPSQHLGPNISASSTPHGLNIQPWDNASVSVIQPFDMIHNPAEEYNCPANYAPSAGLHIRPSHLPAAQFDRPGPSRQHSNSSTDDSFELIQRPRRQDDDSVSTVSSSSSDLSGFVNIRQRHGSSLSHSISQRHSDFDDENLSNFTDLSEDCLPANMMIPSQKSGVRQYKHRRDDGFNATLDWLVFLVLLTGLALGIGHFIGSSQEMAYQHSMNTGQVQRLRELQDDLVTCLDHRTGHNSKITTESSSPALQAIKLLEGLNSRMLADDPDPSHLLEQKVGPDQDVRWTGSEDGVLHPTENGDEPMEDLTVNSNKDEAGKDIVIDPRASILVSSSDGHGQDIEDSMKGKEKMHIGTAIENTNDLTGELQTGKDRGEQGQIEQSDGSLFSDQLNDESSKEVLTEGMNKHATTNSDKVDNSEDDHLHVRVDVEEDIEEEDNDPDVAQNNDVTAAEITKADVEPDVDVELPQESFSGDPESSTIEVLKRKMEMMEEKMDEVIQTAQHWQQIFEESKRVESSEQDESQDTSHSSKSSDKSKDDNEDQTKPEKDPLAGIAATFENLWPGLLNLDHGNEFLQYLNWTEASVKSLFPTDNEDDQDKSISWSEAFYSKLETLKTLPDSEEVQTIINNTKLLADYLAKEMESMKNQSAQLAEEHNITIEGLGEQANSAWTKLKNVTADVFDFNKRILSSIGEKLADTLHTVENISVETIAKQNISLSGVGKMAEQVWSSMKNYSTLVTDGILNATTTERSESKDSTDEKSGFGQKIKNAWDTVRNYSTDFTTKQNLSISGLRKQVKAAWGKVKNTSAQVLEDISDSNLAGRLKDGAQKFGEKVQTTLTSVKERVKRFHKRKSNHEKKRQHHNKFKTHQKTYRHENIHVHKHHRKNRDWDEKDGNGEDFHKKHHNRKQHRHQHNKRHHQPQVDDVVRKANDAKPKKDEDHYPVPPERQHQQPLHDEDESIEVPHSQQDQSHHFSAPPRPQWVLPTHDVKEKTLKQETAYRDGDRSHKKQRQHSVPSRKQGKQPIKSEDPKTHEDESIEMPQSQQDQTHHFSVPPKPQWVLPTHGVKEKTPKQETAHREEGGSHKKRQHSLPSRKQWKKSMTSDDTKSHEQEKYEGDEQDVKMAPRQHLKEYKKEVPPHTSEYNCKGGEVADSNWEDQFDCIDMHCEGDEKCMHSQRKDAARLYSELLDYQDWLKDHHLKKDVRELKEFLEELGEFLSETDSDDEDLDDLKDEFGEMVQDMDDRALKRQRKLHRESQRDKSQTLDDTGKKYTEKKHLTNEDETDENSTVIIDLKNLPQQKESKLDDSQFSSQSHHSADNMNRRKYAGRGFHSTDDGNDWYFQRAKDRAEQRKSPESEENHRVKSNWYLHWAQGRINGRTGVTVWDMYEWIKERYVLREELRRHEMEDHTNWFLRRP